MNYVRRIFVIYTVVFIVRVTISTLLFKLYVTYRRNILCWFHEISDIAILIPILC
jgi:hypothetical protein